MIVELGDGAGIGESFKDVYDSFNRGALLQDTRD